jgi:O-6-methylguanine DNA methyltransferase
MFAKLPRSIIKRMKQYPEFSRKVWCACADIPEGETLTYGELARKIGHPGAARAVGTALAKNPFAPVVPCHRVIRSDGGMGGYSGPGGVETKRKLLEKEKKKCRPGG